MAGAERMNRPVFAILLLIALGAGQCLLLAGGKEMVQVITDTTAADAATDASNQTAEDANRLKSIFSTGEYAAEETYVGEADVERGKHAVRDFDESDMVLRYVATPRISLGVLRFGAEWERFSFGMANGSLLPDTLQSASFIIGLDTRFSDSILVRFEAQPGLYGTNHLGFDEVNMPFIAGGTYIYNSNLQFIVGVGVDVERKYPVIPAAGIRWRIARDWVINAVAPEPRLEYQPSRDVTVYIGANIKETNFRVDEHFGDAQHKPVLNHAVLTYSEVRAGLGADWKISPVLTLTAEAGYQPYRSFDFYRTDIRYHESGSAPYGMISLHGAF
jgi:hypothetical protein